MTRTPRPQSLTLDIPCDLDAASVADVHASLVAALDKAEAGDAKIAVTLGAESGDCSALALQLLASAEQSFPAGTLSMDERGTLALATLTHS